MMQSLTPLVPVALALLLAACGTAGAQPVPVAAVVQVAPAGSVEIVDRLAQPNADALPDLGGLSTSAATSQLSALGLNATVIRFGKGPVSAQWPNPGEPAPADRGVVIWTGAPPKQPARKPDQPAPAAADQAVAAAPAPPAPDAAAAEPAPQQQPQPPAPGGRTPGLENMVAPPHPPRANIRTLAPAKSGTTLQGRASWYGPGFAGHTTACGGVFDPGQLTLASRELRCGTTVTVTGPSGRSVTATVTDWGPAEWTDRRFDLSQATFAAVAGLGSGVIDVTVEVR